MEEPEESLLAVVLDMNFSSLISDGDNIGSVLDCVISFCSSHLMMSSSNRLCFYVSHLGSNELLFPDHNLAPSYSQQGHFEFFSQSSGQLCDRLKSISLQPAQGCQNTPVAAALASCLCYINRQKQKSAPGSRLTCRLLVISAHGSVAAQYMDFMNVFFTAQKMCVPLDACLLAADSGVLRQGADITGGVCFRVPHVRGLLQYLLWLFLPDGEHRQQLTLPAPPLVDYRAACFCHRHLISVGFVCSVCLSIFCKYAPVCSTCHTVFKTNLLPMPRSAKKRKK